MERWDGWFSGDLILMQEGGKGFYGKIFYEAVEEDKAVREYNRLRLLIHQWTTRQKKVGPVPEVDVRRECKGACSTDGQLLYSVALYVALRENRGDVWNDAMRHVTNQLVTFVTGELRGRMGPLA